MTDIDGGEPCTFPGCAVLDVLPVLCARCQRIYCTDHSMDHGCMPGAPRHATPPPMPPPTSELTYRDVAASLRAPVGPGPVVPNIVHRCRYNCNGNATVVCPGCGLRTCPRHALHDCPVTANDARSLVKRQAHWIAYGVLFLVAMWWIGRHHGR